MEKLKIVLADTDESYLMPLELKFISGFEDRAEIDVITDPDYLREFFSTPRRIDILLINEELYDPSLKRHDIGSLFLLTEKPDGGATGDLSSCRLYKYTSVKEIFNEVSAASAAREASPGREKKRARVVLVYSPIGGAGTTTVALGLSAALANSRRRVLYAGMDSLQSFGSFFPQGAPLPPELEKQLTAKNESLYAALRPCIRSVGFDYVPPFSRALSSLNICLSDYIHLAQCVRESGDYDFVVLDAPSDFTEDVSHLMAFADSVLIVALQDSSSAGKFERLLQNLDTSARNKFLFVCNRYDPQEENALVAGALPGRCTISEYIGREGKKGPSSAEELAQRRELRKLAFLFI